MLTCLLSEANVVELAAKATIRNREQFTRIYYLRLVDADLSSFMDLIDLWALEFAEVNVARS